MFVYPRGACSSPSMPPTGSSSSSRASRGPVASAEAARALFALERAPEALARSLLDDVVAGDSRLVWLGARVGLAGDPIAEIAIEDAELVVFDLETTGLSAGRDRMCEIGAVRVSALEIKETFETLVNPGTALPRQIVSLTGLRDPDLRRAPPPRVAVTRFLRFAGEAPLVAHNARFDVGFLDREVEHLTGRRVAAPVVDTVWLARRLLRERSERYSCAARAILRHLLAAVHRRSRTPSRPRRSSSPCWGLARSGARERSRTWSSSPRPGAGSTREAALAAGAPARPGVYLFRDRNETVLYVGKARDLRARLRSYFSALASAPRSRPRSARSSGSSGGRSAPSSRRRSRSSGSSASSCPRRTRAGSRGGRLPHAARGPVGRRDRAGAVRAARQQEPSPVSAARALDGFEGDDLADALPPLRARLRRLATDLRFEDAARVRDRLTALEEVVERVGELERLRGYAPLSPRPGAAAGDAAGVLRRRWACRRRADALPGRGRAPRGGGRARRGRARRAVVRRPRTRRSSSSSPASSAVRGPS